VPTPATPDNELGVELYELMLEPSGASPAAIRDKPGLMSLSFIRAEAPHREDGEAQEEAVAVTVREFIEEASYALEEPISQREDKDADRGAAARCLLGLQSGTDSMLLWERRQRAAGHLVKHVRTLTQRHTKRGKVESHEIRLMDRLADQLVQRENDFLRDNGTIGLPPDSALWLAAVSDAWTVTGELRAQVDTCIGVLRPSPGDEYPFRCDYASLELLGRFWQLVKIPAADDSFLADIHQRSDELATIFPEGLVALLYVLTPFDLDILERLTGSELTLTPEIASPQIVHDLLSQWHDWLALCACDPLTPDASCMAHRFHEALKSYNKQLEKCWAELRDPYRSPLGYKSRRSTAEALAYYAVRPPIDKGSINSV
jgi:hypothetical protein